MKTIQITIRTTTQKPKLNRTIQEKEIKESIRISLKNNTFIKEIKE